MKSRRLATLLGAAALAAGTCAVTVPSANATANGCTASGDIYSHNFTNCFRIHGSGNHVDYMEVYPAQNAQALPTGCSVRSRVYYQSNGDSKYSPWISCASLPGHAIRTTFNRNVPSGTYCGQLQFQKPGGKVRSVHSACLDVHG